MSDEGTADSEPSEIPPSKDQPPTELSRWPLARRREMSRTISGRLVSLANLLHAPVLDIDGRRIGRLHDIVAKWDGTSPNPAITSIMVRAGRSVVRVDVADVALTQKSVSVTATAVAVARAASSSGRDEFFLAQDLLDRQLVDIAGVQVVRAADIYLADLGEGWVVGGVEVSVRAFLRRLFPRRRKTPPPVVGFRWSDVQTFAPKAPIGGGIPSEGPAVEAGTPGSSVRLSMPAAELRKLRAKDVQALLAGLGRSQQAQLSRMANQDEVAEALCKLKPEVLDAMLAELGPEDRARLQALVRRRQP